MNLGLGGTWTHFNSQLCGVMGQDENSEDFGGGESGFLKYGGIVMFLSIFMSLL